MQAYDVKRPEVYNRPMLILWIVVAALTLLTILLGNRHWGAFLAASLCTVNAVYCWRRLSAPPGP